MTIMNASHLSLRTILDLRKSKTRDKGYNLLTPAMLAPIRLMDGGESRIPRSAIPRKTAELMLERGYIEPFYLLAHAGTPAREHFANVGIKVRASDLRPDNGEGEGVDTYNLTRRGREIANTIDAVIKLRRLLASVDYSEGVNHLLYGLDPNGLTEGL